MDQENTKNAKLRQLRALKKKRKNIKKKVKSSQGSNNHKFGELDEEKIYQESAMNVEIDPNDPEYKYKLNYEDPFDDVYEKEIVHPNVDDEESDSDDYESIDAEELGVRFFPFKFFPLTIFPLKKFSSKNPS